MNCINCKQNDFKKEIIINNKIYGSYCKSCFVLKEAIFTKKQLKSFIFKMNEIIKIQELNIEGVY